MFRPCSVHEDGTLTQTLLQTKHCPCWMSPLWHTPIAQRDEESVSTAGCRLSGWKRQIHESSILTQKTQNTCSQLGPVDSQLDQECSGIWRQQQKDYHDVFTHFNLVIIAHWQIKKNPTFKIFSNPLLTTNTWESWLANTSILAPPYSLEAAKKKGINLLLL